MHTKECKDQKCDVKGEQPLEDFPVNKRLPDGRHRYCKKCSARRSREQTQRRNEAQGRTIPATSPERQPRKELPALIRVYLAIKGGKHYQYEIKSAAGIKSEDELGLHLAELMIVRGLIHVGPDEGYHIGRRRPGARLAA